MELPQFTQLAAETLEKSIDIALERGNPIAEDAHLLKAIINTEGTAKEIIKNNGNIGLIAGETDQLIQRLPRLEGKYSGEPRISSNYGQIIQKAYSESHKMGDTFVSQELLLWGLAEAGNDEVKRILKNGNLDAQIIKNDINKPHYFH